MPDLNKDLSKKFLTYLDNKQYKRLQFEADMLGDIEDQHPLIMFYYASSIYLDESSKNEELLISSMLFGKVHQSNKHAQSLYNMIAVSFKTKVFRDVLPLALKAYEEDDKDVILIEGLARIHFALNNRKESHKYFRKLYSMLPNKMEGRLPFISSLNYTSGISQEDYLRECLIYADIVEKKLDIKNDKFIFDQENRDKIKISFLSADFKIHSVSHFLKDVLKKIDKSIFEIHLISNLKNTSQDNMSEELKKIVYKWHDVEDYSDNDLTNYLRSYKFDILKHLCL